MKGILAATAPSSSHVVSQIESFPIAVIYLVVVGLFVLISLRLGKSAWHAVVIALVLGILSNMALPAQTAKLSTFSSTSHRVVADVILLVLLVAALVFEIRARKGKKEDF